MLIFLLFAYFTWCDWRNFGRCHIQMWKPYSNLNKLKNPWFSIYWTLDTCYLHFLHPLNTPGILCRVLALYIRTETPSENLVALVKYILEAYGPSVFDVVLYPQVYNGTYHFFNYAKNAKSCLSEELWAKVSKNFARNG